MGLYLKADLGDAEPLASNSGWSDVLDWVQALPRGEFMALRHLCAYGWSQELPAAAKEAGLAFSAHQPARADVRDTVKNLAAMLKAAAGATVVTVTDGLSSAPD